MLEEYYEPNLFWRLISIQDFDIFVNEICLWNKKKLVPGSKWKRRKLTYLMGIDEM